ncbi:MAG: alpha/beta fold hydrolase [Candidatus Limnocylindrales bacterium]
MRLPPPRVTGTREEQTRARQPDAFGHVEREGVQIFWEVYGEGEQTILLLPTWSIIHSRHWKAQIPFLSRHFRVVTFDGRGNGRSDRPTSPDAYAAEEFTADVIAVMDATGTASASLVAFSAGSQLAAILAAEHPDRVDRVIFIGPALGLSPPLPARAPAAQLFWVELERHDGWEKYNAAYWLANYREFLEFFFGEVFSEPHSTKQIEDCVGWGLESTPEMLVADARAPGRIEDEIRDLCSRIDRPVLVIQGTDDQILSPDGAAELARLSRGQLVSLVGSGHAPHVRDPVKVNELIRSFMPSPEVSVERWPRGRARRRRALFLSSPIGLGHAQRDVAIARELRRLHPDLEIDWLAQDPVTRVLEAGGERIHPASNQLASESGHIESEAGEHDLHCFQAWRRMDEILVANFMVFRDLVRDEPYDLWIGDEAWELDYYLHENPELKTAAYAWLTDFVGWLPMPDGGEREVALTADYNAEMIDHIARYPRIRDRAIFVGNPGDIVPDTFGPGLPAIRAWTEQHYQFSGHITGFDPEDFRDRTALRAELGYGPDEQVCIVSVGGSGVGSDLLRSVIEAYPEAKRRVPNLRMIVVAGPRIDPEGLPRIDGVEIRPYVHELYRHFAACDLAVVQGGLTTTMELTANRRPFLYFPLRHHFEQNFHVRHRLERYDAGRPMDYDNATPEVIAAAIASEIGTEPPYRPVERDGARRAARLIGELL